MTQFGPPELTHAYCRRATGPLGAIEPSSDYRSQVSNKVLGSSLVLAACLVWSFGGAVTEQRLR